MKCAVIVKRNMHFFETCKFASLQIQPSGYGFGCGMVSRLSFLTKSLDIKFSCEPLSNNVSTLVCLEMTLTWNSSILLSSLGAYMWQLEILELDLVSFSFPFKFFSAIAMIFVSSPESDPRSFSAIATIFPFSCAFSLALKIYGFNSGWSFQQWSSSWLVLEHSL